MATSSNKPVFLSPDNPALAGLKDELCVDLGVAQIAHYIDQRTCAKMDLIMETATRNVKQILESFPEFDSEGDISIDTPLPQSLLDMRTLRTGGHFELEFFHLFTSKEMEAQYRAELRFGPKAYLEDVGEQGHRSLYCPPVEPQFPPFLLKPMDKLRYMEFTHELIAVGSEAIVAERQLRASHPRLDAIFAAEKSHAYLDYVEGTRPRDTQFDFHFDPKGKSYFSLLTSEAPRMWHRGPTQQALGTFTQYPGCLAIINNEIFDEPDDTYKLDALLRAGPKKDGKGGPIHDPVAALGGSRSLLFEMGLDPIRDIIMASLHFDIDKCPPASKIFDLSREMPGTTLRRP